MKHFLIGFMSMILMLASFYGVAMADTDWLYEYNTSGDPVIGIRAEELVDNRDKYVGQIVYTVIKASSDASGSLLLGLTLSSDSWVSDIDVSFDSTSEFEDVKKDDIIAIIGRVGETGFLDFGAVQMDECHILAQGDDAQEIQVELENGYTRAINTDSAVSLPDNSAQSQNDKAELTSIITDADWFTYYADNKIEVIRIAVTALKENMNDYTGATVCTVITVDEKDGNRVKGFSDATRSVYDIRLSFLDADEIPELDKNEPIAIIGKVEPSGFFDFGDLIVSDCHIVGRGENALRIEKEIIALSEQARIEQELRIQQEQAEHEQAIADQYAKEMNAYTYDVAYRIGFKNMARYILVDTETNTITEFFSSSIGDKTTAIYSGTLDTGIDYVMNGTETHAETKYSGAIIIVEWKYGGSYSGYKSDVETIKEYGITPETFDDAVITIENNAEFEAILKEREPGSQLIEEFAVKYAGRIVSFDGNIAYMANHGSYSTRFDFLIYPGDYSETTSRGPNFQYKDCAYYDLGFTGDDSPDSVRTGDNLRFTARIEEYISNSELFILDPISTETR